MRRLSPKVSDTSASCGPCVAGFARRPRRAPETSCSIFSPEEVNRSPGMIHKRQPVPLPECGEAAVRLFPRRSVSPRRDPAEQELLREVADCAAIPSAAFPSVSRAPRRSSFG